MDADLKATAKDVRKQTDTLLMEIVLPPNVINQVEEGNSDRCYGLVADNNYLLVCEYGCNGAEPEIIVYKKRSST